MSPDDILKMLNRRSFRPAPFGMERDLVFRDPQAEEVAGGAVGEVAADSPTRRPLVATAPKTVSTEDERSPLLEELGAAMGADERATLTDRRVSADAQDARNRSDRQSNLFLQAAGLPALTKQEDPYVSERDKMRDWLMRRGGVAEGQQRDGRQRAQLVAQMDEARQRREEAGKRQEREDKLRAEGYSREDAKEELRREDDARRLDEQSRHNRAMEGIGWKNADKPRGGHEIELDEDGNIVPKTVAERRQRQREDALKPRPGWEPIDSGAPTFRDAGQAKKFDDAVAALGAIKNHKSHILEGVEKLKHAKTAAEADTVLGEINAQMGAMASKLRDAEGLNNTDASNQAVETMLSLSHGSIVNLRNLANSGRLPAILDAATNSGEANLNTLAEAANLRRSSKGAVPGGAVTVRRKSDGATKVLSKEKATKVLADPNYEEVK